MEEIYKNFEVKRAEALKQLEGKEAELSVEKQKEILKEAVSERMATVQPAIGQQQATAQTAQKLKDQPKDRQIQLLTELAFEKGVVEAVEVAKNLDNPYLLDEFHDALIDEFYKKLVEQGKLKAI
jgi:poly-D-alanine transfer protein DltD